MEIKFDLNNSELFIPNGRLMNLKDKLGFADITISESEIKNICFGIESMNFDNAIKFNYEDNIHKFIHNENIKTQRHIEYNKLPIDIKFNSSHESLFNKLLEDEILNVLENSEELLNNESIKNKLLKLNQLIQINGE